MEIKFNELDKINDRLERIEKLVLENALPKFLPAEMVAKKFGLTSQTLSNLAKDGVLKKHKFGDRKVYYCIPEIYEAIQAGAVKQFNPKKKNNQYRA